MPWPQFLLFVTSAWGLTLRTTKLCSLVFTVTSSLSVINNIHCACRGVVRLPRSTNSAAYQRWVSLACDGPDERAIDNTRQSEILVKNSDFFIPHTFDDASVRGSLLEYITFEIEKLERAATRWWKKFEDMFIRFDRIHKHDRQTDGRTPHDIINRAYA